MLAPILSAFRRTEKQRGGQDPVSRAHDNPNQDRALEGVEHGVFADLPAPERAPGKQIVLAPQIPSGQSGSTVLGRQEVVASAPSRASDRLVSMTTALQIAAPPRDARTVTKEIIAESNETNRPPPDLPLGPWKTREDAENDLKAYAVDKNTGGGAFTLVHPTKLRPGTSATGAIRTFRCNRYGAPRLSGDGIRNRPSLKCGCPFYMDIEETIDGWCVRRGTFVHNHEIAKSSTQVMCDPKLRMIPPEYVAEAKLLKRSIPIAPIYRHLRNRAVEDGIEISFTHSDVYNALKPSPEDISLDATNWIQWLLSRQQTLRLPCRLETNDVGLLTGSYWVMDGGQSSWAVGSRTLLFDCTFNTNRHSQRLGLFSSVSSEGATVILAAVLLESESKSALTWAWSAFSESFKFRPTVVYTDGCGRIEEAVRVTYPGVPHLRCTWHVSKNVWSHLKPYFGSSKGRLTSKGKVSWQRWFSAWWETVMRTDVGTMREQWAVLAKALEVEKVPPQQIEWFNALPVERFCYCFTNMVFSAGVHSTQRCESLHSSLKNSIKASSLLTDLGTKLDDLVEEIKMKKTCKEIKRTIHLHLPSTFSATPTPAIDVAADSITAFALDLVNAQHHQALWYGLEEEAEGGGTFMVKRIAASSSSVVERESGESGDSFVQTPLEMCLTREKAQVVHRTTATTCTCMWHTHMGLPCRHILAVHLKTGLSSKAFPPGLIHTFWETKTEQERKEMYVRMVAKELPSKQPALPEADNDLSVEDHLRIGREELQDWVRSAKELDADELKKEVLHMLGIAKSRKTRIMNLLNKVKKQSTKSAKKKNKVSSASGEGVSGVAKSVRAKPGPKPAARKSIPYDQKGRKKRKRKVNED
ncbi:protein FAR1-RELATED SEQUENCE [Chloropicon roscoffensis]|uniref:Protein FAR1-RELATED SEQUENCE n=1 Tax=Chloropicon roscoffensis TaxID=1461544 RepID=A0AAX4PHP8_9CHLO